MSSPENKPIKNIEIKKYRLTKKLKKVAKKLGFKKIFFGL